MPDPRDYHDYALFFGLYRKSAILLDNVKLSRIVPEGVYSIG
jgi:hypothetical protein